MARFLNLAFACLVAIVPVFGRVPPNNALTPRNDAVTDNAAGSHESLHRRSFFYAGGQYVHNDTAGGTISINKQYVEELTPACGVKHKHPLVFFHGGGDSGVQWLNKPDGGQGWASYFLDRGYMVYIIDIWSVGRSTDSALPFEFDSATVELAQLAFTAPQLTKKYYQAQFHTQWPGTGVQGDPSFDAFYATLLPLNYQHIQQNISRAATCAALARIGPAILISHSAGGSIGFLAADRCPDLVKGHVAVEADQAPFTSYDAGIAGALEGTPERAYGIADVPINYDPPITDPSQLTKVTNGTLKMTDGLISKYPCVQQGDPARQLPNIAKAPVLFLTGEASVHALYDQCLVFYLQQAGVTVEWTKLKDVGIRGNGHFSMLEKNSEDIARYVEGWIEERN